MARCVTPAIESFVHKKKKKRKNHTNHVDAKRERERKGIKNLTVCIVASHEPTLRINSLLVYMRCIFVNSIESATHTVVQLYGKCTMMYL